MKKVAIVSCYFHKNYGSMLQAYATQKIVTELGYDNETIYCNNPQMYMTQNKIKYYIKKISDKDILIDKIKRSSTKFKNKFGTMEYKNNVKIREKKFEEFSQKYFNVTRKYRNREELIKDIYRFSAVLLGSDQLWSPANIENDYYTLTFVPDEIPKIAYATSFGVNELPKYQQKTARDFLERFDAISVRETTGANIVELLCGKKVEVVIDPTLFFDAEAWTEIQPEEPLINSPYIFCYFLGNNTEHRKFAKRLKKVTGYSIVAIQHMDEYIKNDESFADITPYDVGPGEFVSLIRNAEYICTDSFHGTVFSILHRKSFFTFNRFSNSNTISTNSRIDNLLNLLGLEQRRKSGFEDIKNCLENEIEYVQVFDELKNLREQSKIYLQKALEEALQSRE